MQMTGTTIMARRTDAVRPESGQEVEFPKGLLGFEECRRFVLTQPPEYEPFGQLVSLDDPKLRFVVVDPRLIFPHYRVEIDPREIVELASTDLRHITAWAIVTVPDDLARMSVNLQGPLLINRQNNRGKQVALVHSPYTTCHYIMDELQRAGTRRTADMTPAMTV